MDFQMERISMKERDLGGEKENNSIDRINQVLQNDWSKALEGDQFEKASQALDEVVSFNKWREVAKDSSFSSFYKLVEAATMLNKISASQVERVDISDRLIFHARTFSPRIRDLYMGLLSRIDGSSFTPEFPMTERQLQALEEAGDLAVLQDSDTPWEIKLNRMQTRIESELRGRKALDRTDKEKERKQESESEKPEQTTPSPARDESKPSMDEMKRLKEGEIAPATWTITPAYGGYYKEQSFDMWDSDRKVWTQSNYHYSSIPEIIAARRDKETDLVLKVQLKPNQPVRVPIPYTHRALLTYTEKQNVRIGLGEDQNGDCIILPIGTDPKKFIETKVILVKSTKNLSKTPSNVSDIQSNLTEQTERKLQEVQKSRRTNVERARALASYTMRHLKYSNNSARNSEYENHPDGYIGAIDRVGEADCDVANTYFAGLCRKLNIPVRHVVGHMVKGKDKDGNSRITSGTGHAWSEVWDEINHCWERIDATPPGDPQMEQEDRMGEGVPGDYGEQEAIGPTDEELQKFEEKLREHTEKLSYTQEEKELSKVTGIDLKESRQIIKEIQEAENTKLPNGERVVDVMSSLWSLITQSRTVFTPDYTGPLRKREGGEKIEDIVEHKIGIKSDESDPASREKEHLKKTTEQFISAMQVIIVGDKSGSMSQTVDGEVKWQLQRRAMYLVLSSLDRAEKNFSRLKARMREPLGIQTQVISFRNEKDIDEDKPLSNKFSFQDKVNLWQSLGNQGWGNGDVAALTHIYNQIQKEREELVQRHKEDKTLRIIIVCSDGEPDSPAGVHQMAEELGKLNTVVVGIGLTEAAAKAPVIFNTRYSRGDLVKDLNDLPAIVGKHVVMEAIKLFPERAKKQYQKSSDGILRKFEHKQG